MILKALAEFVMGEPVPVACGKGSPMNEALKGRSE